MKFLKRAFFALLLVASLIFLLTRSTNVRIILHRTMRKLFNVKTVVMPVSGGLADQIGWYGCGEDVRKKYHLPVKYAFGWFEKKRTDWDGCFERTSQLKQAFPLIKLEYAGGFEKWLNTTFFRFEHNRSMIPYKEYGIRILKDKFHPIDIDICKDLLDDINTHKSCAVHVRRGDYAHGALGTHPTQAEFFVLAVRKIHSIDPNVKFFFFSEEPDWIRKEILPALDKDIAYRVCDQNDSSKGYLDLYCIAQCDHVICSLGGFGHAGRLFSYKKGYYLRGIASDEWNFDWSLKRYDGEKIGEEVEKGSVDVREGGRKGKNGEKLRFKDISRYTKNFFWKRNSGGVRTAVKTADIKNDPR